jgi:NAD(P)-dependent dehydrogenase (short-subunit alcohol dehydrogenase family)
MDRYAKRFEDRLVLVTGAGSGIGRATACRFGAAGARVVCVDRDGPGAEATAELARARGARSACAEVADVSDEVAMERLAARVTAAHGVLDVLVNNAGIGMSGRFLDTSAEDWRRTLGVNLWGVIHGCRLLGRGMAERRRGGHIVTVASAAAFQPTRVVPAYATSKAAALMLSECLRAELAEFGIGVSVVCPGLVRTPFASAMYFAGASPDEHTRLREASARRFAGRGCPPEKVADAVLRAIVRNTAVVAVTPDARAVRLMSRFAPRLRAVVARLDP